MKTDSKSIKNNLHLDAEKKDELNNTEDVGGNSSEIDNQIKEIQVKIFAFTTSDRDLVVVVSRY